MNRCWSNESYSDLVKMLSVATCMSRHTVNFICRSVPRVPRYLSLSQTHVCRDSSSNSSGREKDQRPPFWRPPSKWRLRSSPGVNSAALNFKTKSDEWRGKKHNNHHIVKQSQLEEYWEPWPKLSSAARLVHSAPSLIPCMNWVTLS